MAMTAPQLRAFMRSRGWDAVALAARIPCTASYIRLLVSGKKTMSDRMDARIRSLRPNAKPVKRQPK